MRNGKPREEYTADDLTGFDASYTKLYDMLAYAEQIGIPKDIWPAYVDEATPYFPCLDDVYSKSDRLREALAARQDQVVNHEMLKSVWDELRQGRYMFITH